MALAASIQALLLSVTVGSFVMPPVWQADLVPGEKFAEPVDRVALGQAVDYACEVNLRIKFV